MKARIAFLLCAILAGFSQKGGAAFSEAPELAAQVREGILPTVESRVPSAPLIITPNDRPGVYGGTWRMSVEGYDHGPLLSRSIGYEQLVRWNQNWTKILPNLAVSWTNNHDATEYIFRLRRGVRWSDGHPFTAEDIVAWITDVASNKHLHEVPPAWLITEGRMPECTALNDHTVRFRFSAPHSLFLEQLAGMRANEMTRYPAHYFRRFHRDHDPDGARRLQDATGMDWPEAFRIKFTPWTWKNHETPTLDAWTLITPYKPGVKKVVAARNPYYWKIDTLGRQLPYIDRVEFSVRKREEIVNAALSGLIDFQRELVQGTQGIAPYEISRARGLIDLVTVIPSVPNIMAISLNLVHPDPEMRKVLANHDVRVALSEAIDREAIIQVFSDAETFPWQIAPRKHTPFQHERLGTQYTRFAPERSARRLDEAGLKLREGDQLRTLPDGKPFIIRLLLPSLSNTEWPLILDMIRETWLSIGVGLEWETLSRPEFYRTIDANLHDGAVWWSGGGLSPSLEPEYYVPATFERLGPLRVFYGVPWARWFLNPDAADAETPPDPVREQLELFRELMETPDSYNRSLLMNRILDIAEDQFYVMGISHAPHSFAVRTPHFKNVPTTLIDSWLYPDPGPVNPAQFFIEPQNDADE